MCRKLRFLGSATRLPRLVILLPLLTFGLAGCGRHDPGAFRKDAAKLDPAWVRHLWLTDDVVVFKDDDSLFAYDLRKRTESGRVKSGLIDANREDLDSGRIHFAQLELAGGSARSGHGACLDATTMALAKLPEDESVWVGNVNRPRYLDYRAKARRQKHETLRVTDLGEVWHTSSSHHFAFQNLIRDSDGALYVLDQGDTWDETTRLLRLERAGKVRRCQVASSRSRIEYRVAHDPASGNYLICQETRDFEERKGPSPLKGHVFDPERRARSETSIPPGPWAVEYGFWDRLKGFSCGISCYANMKRVLVGDRVLLPRYDDEAPAAVLTGKDGCRLLVHQGCLTLLADLCDRPK